MTTMTGDVMGQTVLISDSRSLKIQTFKCRSFSAVVDTLAFIGGWNYYREERNFL